MSVLLRLVREVLIRSARGFDRAARLSSSIAASTLSMRDIRAQTEQKWSRFYALDADIDRGLFPWEQHLVERFMQPGERVLLVGSGTGRDLIALAAQGFEVCGVEPAAAAVAIADAACARRGIAARTLHGYFEDITTPAPFDVVMFSNLCYGLIPESRRRVDVLRKAKSQLAPGGRILLSCVWNRERRRSRSFDVVKLGARLRQSDWHPEDGDVLDPMPGGPPRFHFEHLFVTGEVEAEAAAAGLQVVYQDQSVSEYWLVVLRREVT